MNRRKKQATTFPKDFRLPLRKMVKQESNTKDDEAGVELVVSLGEATLDESELERIVGGTGGNEHEGHTLEDDEEWRENWNNSTPPWQNSYNTRNVLIPLAIAKSAMP